MSLWTSSVLSLLLLQTPTPSEEQPRRLVVVKKDWSLTSAYSDVFKILSQQNPCSDFYGGSRAATTVLNEFFVLVTPEQMNREVTFQMVGPPRLLRDPATGASYRLFNRTLVNTNGSFYQRRVEMMREYPSDIGSFTPGSRQARALILLHELGHLIRDENGDWLIPDDGHNGPQSKANTLRVQKACRVQLETLR
ncbi:MAG TPA: hypothetical protein VFT44_15620 [Pyrinomonadaceae bacterium]|nr:hypothetical protein [Pyrinomonadaceae bacterium]